MRAGPEPVHKPHERAIATLADRMLCGAGSFTFLMNPAHHRFIQHGPCCVRGSGALQPWLPGDMGLSDTQLW